MAESKDDIVPSKASPGSGGTFLRIECGLRLLSREEISTPSAGKQVPQPVECFSHRTATFLIMGPRCFYQLPVLCRGNGYPAITRSTQGHEGHGRRQALCGDHIGHPGRPAGGLGLFAEQCVRFVLEHGRALVEVLVPDFQGDEEGPGGRSLMPSPVFRTCLQTVPWLPLVRRTSSWPVLDLLQERQNHHPFTSRQIGTRTQPGKFPEEVRDTLLDLNDTGCTYSPSANISGPSRTPGGTALHSSEEFRR